MGPFGFVKDNIYLGHGFDLINSQWRVVKLCIWKEMQFVCLLCNETQFLQPLRKLPAKSTKNICIEREALNGLRPT